MAARTASPAEPKMNTQPSPPVGYPLPLRAAAALVRIARCRAMSATKPSPSDPSNRVDASTSVKSSVTIRGSGIRCTRAPQKLDHSFAGATKLPAPILGPPQQYDASAPRQRGLKLADRQSQL